MGTLIGVYLLQQNDAQCTMLSLFIVSAAANTMVVSSTKTAIEKKWVGTLKKNGLTGQMSVLGWYVRLSSEFMALECVRAM